MTKPTLRELLEQTLPPYQPGTHPRYYSMDEARALWIDGARAGLDRAAELAEALSDNLLAELESDEPIVDAQRSTVRAIVGCIRAEKERVMGWSKYAPLGAAPVWYPPGPPAMNVYGHEVPHYSTDKSAAHEVEMKMFSQPSPIKERYGHLVGKYSSRGPIHFEHKPTPEQVCRAALEAIKDA